MTSVSVIIPCYNVEAYIYECLDSVKAQGPIVSELFCVDNNSTDRTISVINTWIETNPEINLITLKETKAGACAARNKPLSLITSDWIQFLDADDILLTGKISTQVKASEKADVIYDSFIKRSFDGVEEHITPQKNLILGLMNGNIGNTCANLWNTSAIKKVGGWNEELSSSQEYDLMMRMYKDGAKFNQLNTFKTLIRAREFGQISHTNPEVRWENYITIRIDFFNFVIIPGNNKSLIHESSIILFNILQILFRYNDKLAIKLHKENFTVLKFHPKSNTIKGEIYRLTYLIFGFAFAEKLRGLLIN
jgi:glycosyltransferase involved in cell wall biosynthesis